LGESEWQKPKKKRKAEFRGQVWISTQDKPVGERGRGDIRMLSIELENLALIVGVTVVQKALRAIVDHPEIHQREAGLTLQKAKSEKSRASKQQETYTVDPRSFHFDPSQHISSGIGWCPNSD
jgi:hypothetical protein